jgi:pyruvate formate lyase activating enzyme
LSDDLLTWRPARFFELQGERVLCTLCPLACALEDGEVGYCQVRRRNGATLETATYATSVEHWSSVERKPLYHFVPGLRVLTLAAPGCSFRCLYCQNYRISQYGRSEQSLWDAEAVSPVAFVRKAAMQRAALALSYAEPSLAAELTLDLARHGKDAGVPVLWKTNGFLTPQAAEVLAPHISAANVDLKASERRHRSLTGAELGPVLETLQILLGAGVWVEISTPLIPGFNTDDASLESLARIVRQLGVDRPWHLVRFNPDFKLKQFSPTSNEDFARARLIAEQVGLRHVYVERAEGTRGRSTVCPQCRHVVVEREIWSALRVELKNGCCPRCGESIAGHWEIPDEASLLLRGSLAGPDPAGRVSARS